jgi:hypothetical protein
MKDRFDPRQTQRPCFDSTTELPFVHVITKFSAVQILRLTDVFKMVYYEDVADSLPVQLVHEVAPYEASSAGNDVHLGRLPS